MMYKYKGSIEHATILPALLEAFGFPNITIAEVGVWKGNSLKLYIDNLKKLNGKVYLIDWWKGSKQVDQGLEMEWKEELYEDIYQQVLDIIEEADAKENVVILKGDCVEMAKQIKDGELDLCFIDAGHSYEECKKHIEVYLPKLKKGGIMSGDDMDGVKSFYDYLLKIGTYTEEELSKDYVEGKGHPGVLQAIWDIFEDNVNPWYDGWYTVVGHRIVRILHSLVDEDHAEYLTSKNNNFAFDSKEYLIIKDNDNNQLQELINNAMEFENGNQVMRNTYAPLIPGHWKNNW